MRSAAGTIPRPACLPTTEALPKPAEPVPTRPDAWGGRAAYRGAARQYIRLRPEQETRGRHLRRCSIAEPDILESENTPQSEWPGTRQRRPRGYFAARQRGF